MGRFGSGLHAVASGWIRHRPGDPRQYLSATDYVGQASRRYRKTLLSGGIMIGYLYRCEILVSKQLGPSGLVRCR
jgi:hypothetical protein